MIIDYPGQEVIWNLTATHPYKQNHGNYKIMVRCKTPKQHYETVKFFKDHLNGKTNVRRINSIDINTGLTISVVDKLTVSDAFGGFGEVVFLNEFCKEVRNVSTEQL